MIEAHVLEPVEVSPFGWMKYQQIARAAYSAALGSSRTQEEIDYLVRWERADEFSEVRIDPNISVGDRLFSNQSYSSSRIAVATIDGVNPVGYGYMANNVSGSVLERQLKMLSDKKKYAWIGEIVVTPAASRQGVAKEIGKKLLQTASPNQPVSAFVWPEENEGVAEALTRYGFKSVGESKVSVFGPDSRPTTQLMMKADSVSAVLEHLKYFI